MRTSERIGLVQGSGYCQVLISDVGKIELTCEMFITVPFTYEVLN